AEAIDDRENVRHLGYVPAEDLPALYRTATAFVYPSLYEGFGLPPLEAMACETPVVASEAASIPEVVGDAALLVDPRDADEIASALERVLTDAKLRDELIDAGRARARAFSWRTSARRLADVFEEVAAERRRT
uniref:glycosyltransferase family 4 protein n=1 Tax=Halovivax sp. TaxID=1935978 RepID=UPI0025BAF438